MFCSNAMSSCPHGVATRYWVETPKNEASVMTPLTVLRPSGGCAPARCRWSFSGRTPMITRSEVEFSFSAGSVRTWPNARTVTCSPRSMTFPGIRFDWPRKLAANAVCGVS